MALRTPDPRRLALAVLVVSSACTSTSLDGTDRRAFFFEARGRKEIEGPIEGKQTFVEGAWTRATGDAGDFEYSINTLNGGMAFESELANEGRVAVAVGLSVLTTEFETAASRLDDDFSLGPYVAVEGGWRASPTIEPFARIEAAGYLLELSSIFAVEIGARVHVIDNAALFAGWRYTRYNTRDLDSLLAVDRVDLDASGIVLGLSVSF